MAGAGGRTQTIRPEILSGTGAPPESVAGVKRARERRRRQVVASSEHWLERCDVVGVGVEVEVSEQERERGQARCSKGSRDQGTNADRE